MNEKFPTVCRGMSVHVSLISIVRDLDIGTTACRHPFPRRTGYVVSLLLPVSICWNARERPTCCTLLRTMAGYRTFEKAVFDLCERGFKTERNCGNVRMEHSAHGYNDPIFFEFRKFFRSVNYLHLVMRLLMLCMCAKEVSHAVRLLFCARSENF